MLSELDLDALHGFIAESNDSLQAIESDFIELENDPGNNEIINNIFRPVHSLKGNSGFFGLTNINKFAHRFENLLDYLRKGELIVTNEIIDLLLSGVDHLKEMLARAEVDPGDVTLRPAEEECLAVVEEHKPAASTGSIQSVIKFEAVLQEAMDAGIIIDDIPLLHNLLSQIEISIDETKKFIEEAKAANTVIYPSDARYFLDDTEYTQQIWLLIDTDAKIADKKPLTSADITKLKTALAVLISPSKTNKDIAAPLAELSSLANFLDDDLMAASPEFTGSCRTALNQIIASFTAEENTDSDQLGEILVANNLVSAEKLTEVLGKQKKLGELLIAEDAIKEEDLKMALQIQEKKALRKHLKHPASKEIAKTIRIDQDKLDSFANAVGDLFISVDTITFLKKQLEEDGVDANIITKFDNTIRTVSKVVEQLHDKVMGIRRVPIRSLLQRFPRLIRQLSNTLSKDINFVIKGEETVIDKDLIEKIENPLVHILRNSVDHGIELPEDRRNQNKPAQGTLQLITTSDENNIHLTIIDDGKGIDPQKMREVAVQKGFMSQKEVELLSDHDLVNLIFRPGFSAAEKLTDVSGRGVGMDVVLASLKECNGQVQVESKVNAGTTIAITIPVTRTLVTRDAMVIKSKEQTYILPSDDITTVIETDNIIQIINAGCIAYDNQMLRIIDLNSFFNPNSSRPAKENTMKAFALSKTYQIAIMVDQVINHQKVVVKDFKDGYRKLNDIDGIKGYTIMGDEVTLIIDVAKLAEQT